LAHPRSMDREPALAQGRGDPLEGRALACTVDALERDQPWPRAHRIPLVPDLYTGPALVLAQTCDAGARSLQSKFTVEPECAKLPVILDARPRALVACPGSRPLP